MPFRYPVALELGARRCVVTGGSRQAEAKVRALLDADADVVVIAPRVTNGIGELARRGEITHMRRRYRHGDLAGAFLAIAANSDRATRAEVFAEAEEERVLCNAVDDVAHCHFAVPSVVRRGELLLAVSTGGRAPALARHLRRRLSRQFGWQWEALVDVLGEVRAEVLGSRPADFSAWSARWRHVLDREEELLGLLEEGGVDEVRARIYDALNPASTAAHCSGSLR